MVVTTGDADTLFPPLVLTTTGRAITEQIYDYLAEVGPDLNTASDKGFRRELATSWTWGSDSLSIRFQLARNARWHDGQPVTSHDVVFSFAVYSDSALGWTALPELANIDSVTAADDSTAVFWFHRRSPTQFHEAAGLMQILPRHVFEGMTTDSLRRVASSMTPIGSGRYRFVHWTRTQFLEIAADTANYRGSPGIGRLIWRITPDPRTAAQLLFAGEADIYDVLRRENVREADRHDIRLIISPGTDYVFMQFNFKDPAKKNRAHPLFQSRELRRALSMAVDRQALVRSVFDSLARTGIGPTLRSYPSTDSTLSQLPYDPERAAAVLDSLGWRRNPDTGVRARAGRQFRFKLVVPASSLNRTKMAVLLQEQFRRVGVAVDIDQMDYSAYSARRVAGEFDAVLGDWHLGTDESAVRDIWTSSAATRRGGVNYGFYMNPAFDAYVDSAMSTFDGAQRKQYYTRAYQIAIGDAPAIWLYEPRTVLGIHKRIRTGPMRPDAWWYSLADWHIPATEQIRRDRVR